jgi:hypothetical protein
MYREREKREVTRQNQVEKWCERSNARLITFARALQPEGVFQLDTNAGR